MTEERLNDLNKLQRRIKDREEALNTLKKFREKKVVITDYIDESMRIPSVLQEVYNDWNIRIPDELHDVFLTLLEDYYIRKLNDLKEEFKSVAGELRTEHKIDIMNYSHMGDGKPNVHVYRGIEEVADALNAPLIIKDSGISKYPIKKEVIVDDIIYYEICKKEVK